MIDGRFNYNFLACEGVCVFFIGNSFYLDVRSVMIMSLGNRNSHTVP
jgi:hypothetical protein